MGAQVFEPDDAGGAAVHDEVGPLVDEGDIIEWGLGEERGERQHAYQCQAEQRKWVFSDKLSGFLHIYYLKRCKSKKYLVLLQAL